MKKSYNKKECKTALGQNENPYGEKQCYYPEHATVTSRTTGRKHEIGFGPQPGGLVPANPFASLAQEGYLHAHPAKLGKDKLKEFDEASKGKKLPYKVKK